MLCDKNTGLLLSHEVEEFLSGFSKFWLVCFLYCNNCTHIIISVISDSFLHWIPLFESFLVFSVQYLPSSHTVPCHVTCKYKKSVSFAVFWQNTPFSIRSKYPCQLKNLFQYIGVFFKIDILTYFLFTISTCAISKLM